MTCQVPSRTNVSLKDREYYNVPSGGEGLVHANRIWKDGVMTISNRLTDPVTGPVWPRGWVEV